MVKNILKTENSYGARKICFRFHLGEKDSISLFFPERTEVSSSFRGRSSNCRLQEQANLIDAALITVKTHRKTKDQQQQSNSSCYSPVRQRRSVGFESQMRFYAAGEKKKGNPSTVFSPLSVV